MLRKCNSEPSLATQESYGGRGSLGQEHRCCSQRLPPAMPTQYEHASTASSTIRAQTAGCSCGSSAYSVALNTEKILSLPLMEVIVDVVRSQPNSASNEQIEQELLSRLAEEINDTTSPWYGFEARPPPIAGERTPEQYLCALDIALAARLGLRNERRICKFWKRLALHADPSTVTPSPSDVSDTGLSADLTGSRQEMLDNLLKKGAIMGHSVQSATSRSRETISKLESGDTAASSRKNDSTVEHVAEDIPDQLSVKLGYAGETTLVDDDVQTGPHIDTEGEKELVPRMKYAFSRRTSNANSKSLIPKSTRGSRATKSPRASSPLSSSVQTKLLLFENLGRAPPQPERKPARTVATKTLASNQLPQPRSWQAFRTK